jgi:Protein of unknown function (DUF1566).
MIEIGGKKCSLLEGTPQIQPGQEKQLNCYGVIGTDEGNDYSSLINITYRDTVTDASYVQHDNDVRLIGKVLPGAELHTGQQICYNTDADVDGDDDCDALESTMPLQDAHHDGTTKSFQDNADGTITDLHTGLMWNKSDDTGLTCQEALELCDTSESAGYSDWRVPNAVEVMTMIDYSLSDYEHPAFTWSGEDYWSSTSQSDDLNDAMYVDTGWGGVPSQTKSDDNSDDAVRCVRGTTSAINLKQVRRSVMMLMAIRVRVQASERTHMQIAPRSNLSISVMVLLLMRSAVWSGQNR